MADQDVSSMVNFDLEDMFSYSLTWTILAVIVVLILLLIYYFLFIKKTKQQFVIPHYVGKDAIKSFDVIEKMQMDIGNGGVICMKEHLFPIDDRNYFIPIELL